MVKKRLIGVVTVKDGWAVQSFGYRRYLPLGKPEFLVENLSRWGADEILVLCIDRSRTQSGPDFNLLKQISRLGLSTPLIYGGGVDSVDAGIAVIQQGADRICVDALLRSMVDVSDLSEQLGAQALIAALPLEAKGSTLAWFDYLKNRSGALSADIVSALENGTISEALVIDRLHEGLPNGFDLKLIEQLPLVDVPIIPFGGLSDSEQIRNVFSMPEVAAVAVGNFLNYREHAVQTLKSTLAGLPVRPPAYDTMNSSS